MSKQEEAALILRLYELRREPVMREARDWYFREFNPKSFAEFTDTLFSAHSGHLRMVVSYWDMAAALVNSGAIGLELFTESNGEHIGVFSKIEPFIAEFRAQFAPQFAVNFEKLIDATPDGRKRVAQTREMFKGILARMQQQNAQGAQKQQAKTA